MTDNSTRNIFCHIWDSIYQKICRNPRILNLVKPKDFFMVVLSKIQSTRQESKHRMQHETKAKKYLFNILTSFLLFSKTLHLFFLFLHPYTVPIFTFFFPFEKEEFMM